MIGYDRHFWRFIFGVATMSFAGLLSSKAIYDEARSSESGKIYEKLDMNPAESSANHGRF